MNKEIIRSIRDIVINNIKPGFVSIIYGPRRIGKTVLLGQIAKELGDNKILFLNGDVDKDREVLSTTSDVRLSQLVSNYSLILVDEAQRIENISVSLKILVDKFPDKKIIVTGSSSLELAAGIHDNLTGRNLPYILYPFSTLEISKNIDRHKIVSLLEDQLVYGGYPYLQHLARGGEEEKYLELLIRDYLFKDTFLLRRVDSKDAFKKLATMLAFQIGSEVSFNELANNLGIDVVTVIRYIELLKQSFVVFELGAYSNNRRKEISKSKKYYFYDLGIRNALVEQFLPLDVRPDVGALWENFLVVERLKKHQREGRLVKTYFWRNYLKAEIDLIEREGGDTRAYEFKVKNKKYKTPKAFHDMYKIESNLVSRDNYLEFVL